MGQFLGRSYPFFLPEEVIEVFDAGRSYKIGQPPATIAYGVSQKNHGS